MYVCKKCGSSDLDARYWAKLNDSPPTLVAPMDILTEQVSEEYNVVYCNECQEHCVISLDKTK